MEYTELVLNKEALLNYFRNKATSKLMELQSSTIAKNKKTRIMNNELKNLLTILDRDLHSISNDPPNFNRTTAALLTYYCYCVVSIECRNTLWEYTSMDLSRRSGELWENFVKRSWEYSVKSINAYNAPDFHELVNEIKRRFASKLGRMNLAEQLVDEIVADYEQAWYVVGDTINPDSDQLFESDNYFVVIDFKGSYGSNEKGNKDRLLAVAKIYKILDALYPAQKPHKCILAVRTIDGNGHNYLRQLEDSTLWTVERGSQNVYNMAGDYTGYNFYEYLINKYNLNIIQDFQMETRNYMQGQNTSQHGSFANYYLNWF